MSAPRPAPARRGPTRRRILVQGCLVATAVAAGWVAAEFARDGKAEAEAAAADALQRRIEARGRFKVVTTGLQARIGPSVVLPDRPVAITDLGPARLEALRSVEAALTPYPDGFVARLLDTVALAGEVVFWTDTPVGGFFFPRGLCLNAGNPADRGETTTRLFHHELSSLVRLAAPFDEARWTGFNPPGFAYLDEAAYRALLKDAPHQAGGSALNERGFVRPYGESDLDNDWNTYAEAMFGDGAGFAALIRPFPRMRGKAAMLIDLYRGLDRGIAGYFERTGLASAAAG